MFCSFKQRKMIMNTEETIKQIATLIKQDLSAAQAACDAALAQDPHNAVLYYLKAAIMWNASEGANLDQKTFFSLLEQAIKLNPNDSQSYKLGAYVHSVFGDFDAAEKGFARALEITPNDWELYLMRAKLRMQQHKFPQVLEDCNVMLAKQENDAAYALRARAKEEMKDYAGAIQDADKAMALNPQYGGGFLIKCNCKLSMGDEAGALEELNKGVQLFPKMADFYEIRCAIKQKLGDCQGAINDAQEAMKRGKTTEMLFLTQAQCKLVLRDFAGAVEICTAGLSSFAQDASLYVCRAIAQEQLKNYAAAVHDAAAATKLGNTTYPAFLIQIRGKLTLKDPAGAVAVCDEALKFWPQEEEIYYCRGDAKIQLNDLPGALKDVQQVYQLKPNETHRQVLQSLQQGILQRLPAGTEISRCTLPNGQQVEQVMWNGETVNLWVLDKAPAPSAPAPATGPSAPASAPAPAPATGPSVPASAPAPAASAPSAALGQRKTYTQGVNIHAAKPAANTVSPSNKILLSKKATALITACKWGKKEEVKALLGNKAILRMENFGETPLIAAIKGMQAEVVEILLKAGADVNQKNNQGTPPLVVSAQKGNLPVLQLLLADSARDIEAADANGETAFIAACAAGHLPVVRALVMAGANTQAKNKRGRSGFALAQERYHNGVVEYLTSLGIAQ